MTLTVQLGNALTGSITWYTATGVGEDWQIDGDERGIPNWRSTVTVSSVPAISLPGVDPDDGWRIKITEDTTVLADHVLTGLTARRDDIQGWVWTLEGQSEEYRILTHDFVAANSYAFDPGEIALAGYAAIADLFLENTLLDEPAPVNSFYGAPSSGTTDPDLDAWVIEKGDSLLQQLQDYADIIGNYRFGSDGLGKIGFFDRKTSGSSVQVTLTADQVTAVTRTKNLSDWANMVKLTFDWWDTTADEPATLTVRTTAPAQTMKKVLAVTRRGNPGGSTKALTAAEEIRDRHLKLVEFQTVTATPNRSIKPGTVVQLPIQASPISLTTVGVVETVTHTQHAIEFTLRPR